jgi:hypothetical protein
VAVTHVRARDIGGQFAQAVRKKDGIVGLWTTCRNKSVHLWLLVEPIEDDAEQQLYELLDVLDARFPNTDVQLHVLNPATYSVDPRDVLPQDAEEIPLNAA